MLIPGRTEKQFLFYYILFFLCLVILFVPLYQINLSMVSQTYRDTAASLLETGLSNLEREIGLLEAVAKTVYDNPRFRRVSYWQENMELIDYYHAISLVEDFKRYFSSMEMIMDCGILYNNGMILTSKRLHFPQEKFYGRYFSQAGIADSEQWITEMFDGNLPSRFVPQSSFTTLESAYEGIAFCMKFSDVPEKRSFFFATLEKEYILSRLATDEVLKRGRLLVFDPPGNIIIDSSNDEAAVPEDNIILEMTGRKRGFRVRMVIPPQVFRERLAPFRQLAFFFVLAYLSLGIVLSLFFAQRSARPIRKIVEDVLYFSRRRIPEESPEEKPPASGDEYNYIRHFLSRVEQNFEDFNTRLIQQEELQKDNLFERLLNGLIYSASSWQMVQDLFPAIPPVFRIAALALPGMEDAVLSVHTMRQAMIEDIVGPCLPKNSYIHFSGNILILLLPDEDQEMIIHLLHSIGADLRGKLNLDCRIALSEPVREIRDIHRAFFQTRHLLRFPSKHDGAVVLRKENQGLFPSMEFLDASRLYELLYHGEEDKAVDFVNNMFYELCRRGYTSEDDIQQIFFLYRRVIIQIAADFELDFSREEIVPVYDSELELSFLFARMAEALRKICIQINSRYKEKNNGFERSILKYIDDNITNSNLYTKLVTDSFRISENRLQTIVRKWTGKSFLEYVESRRMLLSREMLLKTPKPISQISRECGYSLENSFYKAFRRYYGQSPGEIRRHDEKPALSKKEL